ncbi:helix-turn-helix transcriptional regulator [Streptomyces sp. SID3343]|uniref:helix-turn-helix transcriptional regulator n=1 Tax=Streptomyces sp. SID3343 TaxID=2690260 RepID=UPI0013721E4C|nr:helix-turn-helix transcriptional regulator [Streptomyces sp. SID3343]MYV98382.1 helix-turn-helix domain-containing protein [Streptomyces sp. SID3343]
MTNDEWVAGIAALLGAQVRRYRKERGMTTQQLAETCAALGADVPASVIGNVETGRRASFGVAELLVVAKALDLAPVNLLFPLGRQETVQVLPDSEVPVWDAVTWFTDETPLAQAAPEGSPRAIVDAFRVHADAVTTACTSQRLLGEHQRKAATTLNAARRADHVRSADQFGEMLLQDAQALRALRADMRTRDLFPPALPEGLAFIDEPDDEGGNA